MKESAKTFFTFAGSILAIETLNIEESAFDIIVKKKYYTDV